MSVECQGCLWVSRAAMAMSRICQGWFRSVWVYLRVSWGCWRVYEGLRGVSGSIFLSISFNFRKPQIISLTFSNRPGGLRCLKYQNVPKLRSFWPIGKPRERFQSWDIRVYFISVPNDHTVAGQIRGQVSVCRAWNALPNNVEHKVEAIMEPFRSPATDLTC